MPCSVWRIRFTNQSNYAANPRSNATSALGIITHQRKSNHSKKVNRTVNINRMNEILPIVLTPTSRSHLSSWIRCSSASLLRKWFLRIPPKLLAKKALHTEQKFLSPGLPRFSSQSVQNECCRSCWYNGHLDIVRKSFNTRARASVDSAILKTTMFSRNSLIVIDINFYSPVNEHHLDDCLLFCIVITNITTVLLLLSLPLLGGNTYTFARGVKQIGKAWLLSIWTLPSHASSWNFRSWSVTGNSADLHPSTSYQDWLIISVIILFHASNTVDSKCPTAGPPSFGQSRGLMLWGHATY